jgi:16S rRNA (guanine527-N7)-methyltransferase
MEHVEPLDTKQVAESAVSQYPALPFDPLFSYLSAIVEWNERIGLVSRQRPLEVLARLVSQSARLWEMVTAAASPVTRAIDIGTGAGFPGMIWKLLSPGTEIVLVDRRANKATFLQRTVAVLGLDRVEVFQGEAEDAARHSRLQESFDAAATMTVGPLDITIPLVTPFLRPGGVYATVLPTGEEPPPSVSGFRLVTSETDPGGTRCLFRRAE